jgi:putative ABC transport system permease protein
MMIFLIESGLLGLVGGMIGIAVGFVISKGIETVTLQSQLPFSASYPWWLFVGALSFSFIIGCISGLVPALKAAKMKPADSIRY